jgi:radical SAM protein with 4Fe4S-binding SPASM domain
MKIPVTAYIKPTNYCNVGCSHCYLSDEVRANRYVMTDEKLQETAQMLLGMKTAQHKDNVHIIWHGGEPLVMPVEYFYRAGGILDGILPGHTESLQTSLIPYRREYADLVHDRFASQIGTSIDFTQRKIKNSSKDYQILWMRKVDLVREDNIAVIPGVVPTKYEVVKAAEMTEWFLTRGIWIFNVERYNKYRDAFPDWPSNMEHSQFLINLFDALMERIRIVGEAPMVQVIEAGIKGVLHGISGDRWGSRCMHDFIVVEPNGFTNNCTDKSSFDVPFSNVSEGYEHFAKSPQRLQSIRLQVMGHKGDHCHVCEFNHWCGSGCPITPNGAKDDEQECSGYKVFLKYVQAFNETEEGEVLIKAYLEQDMWKMMRRTAIAYKG